MIEIYKKQLEEANSIESNSDSLNYLTSILRSVLQVSAISVLELVLKETPSINDDLNIDQLIDRFSSPSDGLPIEIIDQLVPRVRSLVFGSFYNGWYEDRILDELQEWIKYRNKRLGHGVVDAPLTLEWVAKTKKIISRLLDGELGFLPKVKNGNLIFEAGDSSIKIETPVLIDGYAQVVSKVVKNKGVVKVITHSLNWFESKEITTDIQDNSIFLYKSKYSEKYKCSDIVMPNGEVFSIIHNIPVRQTTNFVGRKKELEKLKEWMGDYDFPRACLVHGDGGFGKTTLVLEFFNDIFDGNFDGDFNFPSIISFYTAKKTKWTENGLIKFKGVSDAMEDSVRELIYCLRPVLGKDWFTTHGSSLIDKAAGELKSEKFNRDDILLIIDNTETLASSQLEAEELSNFLSKVSRKIGRVLITSRRREYLAAEPIPVSKLSEIEALQLINKLGAEYNAKAIQQAGEARLRSVCEQLMYKPLLIDTLVRYIARSSSSIQDGLDQILRKTNDELLEFLYEDAWERMTELVKEVFLVLVSLANPIDGKCVGDVCMTIGVQHAEFQESLNETYFSTIVDYGDNYDLEIVELAKKFFLKKKGSYPLVYIEKFDMLAAKLDKSVTERMEIDRNYRLDRVADAFRSDYAKAAKIDAFKRDYKSAKNNFELALLEEPLNSALHDRYASFLMRIMSDYPLAIVHAKKSVELDINNGDGWLTLGLVHNKYGDIKNGDECLDKSVKLGKSEILSNLQKAISRYHLAKKNPYSKDSLNILNTALQMIDKSYKINNSKDFYYQKNLDEMNKYKKLILSLVSKIRKKEALVLNI